MRLSICTASWLLTSSDGKYGVERAGYPFFEVTSVSQAVQVEVKYSEAFIGLKEPFVNGPFIFATSLAKWLPSRDIQYHDPWAHSRTTDPGRPAMANYSPASNWERGLWIGWIYGHGRHH